MGCFCAHTEPVAPTCSLYHYQATQCLKEHGWNVCASGVGVRICSTTVICIATIITIN